MFGRPRLVALLALLFALRASVPVGYMLSLPAGAGGGGAGLVFCPVQNPGLNLDQLLEIGGPAESQNHPHGHHDHRDPQHGDDDDYAVVEITGDCALWAESAGAAPPLSTHNQPIALANEPAAGLVSGRTPRQHRVLCASPRGPPLQLS